jgi:hypothetical protein
MGLFIEGLKPFELMRFVKKGTLVDLQATINRAKLWETINVITYYFPNSNSMIGGSWTLTPQFPSLPMPPPQVSNAQPPMYQSTYVGMYVLAPLLDKLFLVPILV